MLLFCRRLLTAECVPPAGGIAGAGLGAAAARHDDNESGDISRAGAHETGVVSGSRGDSSDSHDISKMGAHSHGNQGFSQVQH